MVDRSAQARGRLFVVSGPSGAGKGTAIRELLGSRRFPLDLFPCVTATTREKRPNEVDGRDYFFFTPEEFQQRIAEGFFLEHVVYNGHCYGTPVEEVERRRASGGDVLLEVDVRGGLSVRARFPDAILIFLVPPSAAELERRLRARGTNCEEDIQERLAAAHRELEAAARYDYLVINDTIVDAVTELRAIIVAERCRNLARTPETG